MNYYGYKKLAGSFAIGTLLVLGAAGVGHAQDRDRYRVRYGGSYYTIDSRGAEALRKAVREGYREGFQAGRDARYNRYRGNWRNNGMYRSGDMGYNSYVGRDQYQYYFRQGFQKGYEDGYYGRNRYGRNSSILDVNLNRILRFRIG